MNMGKRYGYKKIKKERMNMGERDIYIERVRKAVKKKYVKKRLNKHD
jgi:hypothetical protein